jgi:hypothetical protein
MESVIARLIPHIVVHSERLRPRGFQKAPWPLQRCDGATPAHAIAIIWFERMPKSSITSPPLPPPAAPSSSPAPPDRPAAARLWEPEPNNSQDKHAEGDGRTQQGAVKHLPRAAVGDLFLAQRLEQSAAPLSGALIVAHPFGVLTNLPPQSLEPAHQLPLCPHPAGI